MENSQTFTYDDGSTYIGMKLGDMRHGQGTFTEPDGSMYVGVFKDGELYEE